MSEAIVGAVVAAITALVGAILNARGKARDQKIAAEHQLIDQLQEQMTAQATRIDLLELRIITLEKENRELYEELVAWRTGQLKLEE